MQMIQVGLCAFGMSGRVFHAPFFNEHPGFHLAGIVERSKNESQEKYPSSTLYRSVEELLANPDIELVVVNTPVQTHYDYCKKALNAGKNVIVEKPFTVNATEAEELVELAKSKNVFLSVFQNRRFDRDFMQVDKILKENVLGDIKEVEIRFDRFRPQAGSKIHKENPSLPGSGALHDLGTHLLDQAVVLFGKPISVFADVFSMKGSAFANDYFEILLAYADEKRVRLKGSVFSKEDHYAYKVFGSQGCFLQERSDDQENELVSGAIPVFNEEWTLPLTKPDGILNIILNDGSENRSELTSAPGNYMHYFQEIYEHMVFGNALPSPASEIVLNMKLVDMALQSSAEKRWISFT